jgi:hypothetical protein
VHLLAEPVAELAEDQLGARVMWMRVSGTARRSLISRRRGVENGSV